MIARTFTARAGAGAANKPRRGAVQADNAEMTSAELPEDVSKIVEYLAASAQGYGGKLKWNEIHKFKGDLMNARGRWHPQRVLIAAFQEKCLARGLSEADRRARRDALPCSGWPTAGAKMEIRHIPIRFSCR